MEWSKLNPGPVDLFKNSLSFYFCQPYSSLGKGVDREYESTVAALFAEGENVPWSTGNEVMAHQIEDVMNGKPKKVLGYRPTDEVEKERDPRRRPRS